MLRDSVLSPTRNRLAQTPSTPISSHRQKMREYGTPTASPIAKSSRNRSMGGSPWSSSKEAPSSPNAGSGTYGSPATYTPTRQGPPSKQRSPGTPLRWEHPAMKDVAAHIAKYTWTELDAKKMTYNGGFLALLVTSYQLGYYQLIQTKLLSPKLNKPAHIAFIFLVILTLTNVVVLLFKYFRPLPTFADYSLTPAQRLMLGLDPNTPASAQAAEQSKYASVVKPAFEPSPHRGQSMLRPRPTSYGSATPRRDRGLLPSGSSPASPLAKYMLSTSPVSMDIEPIRDRRALDEMLTTAERHATDADYVERDDSVTFFRPSPHRSLMSPSVPKFQPALKTSTPAKIQERIEDGIVVKEAQKTLDEWNVENYIDEWTENMRTWLARKVLKPLANRIRRCDKEFTTAGLEHLTCAAATMQAGMAAANKAAIAAITASTSQQPTGAFGGTTSGGLFGGAATPSGLFGASTSGMFGQSSATKPAMFGATQAQSPTKPTNLYELSQQSRNEPLVQERMKLENYLSMPNYECRAYIVERIQQLAEGSSLASFKWNGGSSSQGHAWSQEWLPTDSQLVMHLFCRFLDENMPGENFAAYGNYAFSSKYFVPVGSKPDPARSIQLRNYTKWPPHYNLVVEGVVYDVYPGRNNMLQAQCLFAYYLRSKASSYIGLLHVGGKAIDLTQVVSRGPAGGRFSESQPAEGSDTGEYSQARSSTSANFVTSNRRQGGGSLLSSLHGRDR
ncbi:cytochrome B561, N terminal-domain-containing protein [Gaertneriomyces semiglobifer]|nr:cytochrome B561, N terminal-domain-containing protein [Gaertneriomyces semiglobifer]